MQKVKESEEGNNNPKQSRCYEPAPMHLEATIVHLY